MGKKIFANDVTQQGARVQNIQTTHITQYQSNKQPNQRQHQMNNWHMKRCSRKLTIRKMQIETTMRYLFIPVRMAVAKKNTNNRYWQGCGEKGTLLQPFMGM